MTIIEKRIEAYTETISRHKKRLSRQSLKKNVSQYFCDKLTTKGQDIEVSCML